MTHGPGLTVIVEDMPAGEYTSVTGNTALAWGLVAAGQLAKLPITLGSYPITPASDVLHELSRHKNFGVRTFQAEDEIAAMGATIGAAFGGALAATGRRRATASNNSGWLSRWATAALPICWIECISRSFFASLSCNCFRESVLTITSYSVKIIFCPGDNLMCQSGWLRNSKTCTAGNNQIN